MHRNRIRNALARWVESTLEHATETAAELFTPTSDAEPPSDAQDGEPHASEAGRRWVISQLKSMLKDGEWSAERAAEWVENHGEDAWIAFLGRWERVSREVVDDMLDGASRTKNPRAPDASSPLAPWDRAARKVTELIVEAMMSSSNAPSSRKKRRSSTATSEIHEYTGHGAGDD